MVTENKNDWWLFVKNRPTQTNMGNRLNKHDDDNDNEKKKRSTVQIGMPKMWLLNFFWKNKPCLSDKLKSYEKIILIENDKTINDK